MSFPIISDDRGIQEHYESCRRQGTSHTLAEMFALSRPPQSDTDREFLVGSENGRQFQGRPEIGDEYKRVAESMGQNVKGKKYLSSLARFPGDPLAWVSSKDDVKRVCEERGWACDGRVKVKGREVAPPEQAGVADDIVNDELERVIESAPDPRAVNIPETRQKIVQRRQKRK